MVQGSTDLCANTSCWPLGSTHPRQSGSSPRPNWSGPPTGGRAPCCWMSSHSTVRPSAVEEQDTSCKASFFFFVVVEFQRHVSAQTRSWRLKWSRGRRGSSWPCGFCTTGRIPPGQVQFCVQWLCAPANVSPLTEGFWRRWMAGRCLCWLMAAGLIWPAQTLSWICWLELKLRLSRCRRLGLLTTSSATMETGASLK